MDPLITYFKQQKPELEPYLTMIEQWRQQEEETDEAENTIDVPEEAFKIEKEPDSIAASEPTKKQLLKTIRILKFRLKAEIKLNHCLADALGACPECFGECEDCDYCSGDGAPGYEVPDYDLFTEYVVPAIRNFNMNYQKKTFLKH